LAYECVRKAENMVCLEYDLSNHDQSNDNN